MAIHSIWELLTADNQKMIPANLLNWLSDTGSLTAKLRSICDDFSVSLIDQTKREAQHHEIELLGLNEGDHLIDREVQLYCGTIPVIYARSLIPLEAIHDRFNDLDSMGEKPLGEKIFSDPQLSRSPIEWTQLTTDHPLFTHAMQRVSDIPESIYGRRSLFFGAKKPIVISEFFLPEITNLMN